ncbi:MAG: protein-disulfide reductase DsbD [Lentisphaerota bacterium]
MKSIKYFILFLFPVLLLASGNLLGAILPADEAFKLTAQRLNNSTIQAQWDIAEGYHLYKSEISISLDRNNGTVLGQITLPKGIPEHSHVLGDYEVYKKKLIIDIPIVKWGKNNTELVFNYQGCKESSACYPPVTKVLSIAPPIATIKESISSPTLSSTQNLLASGNILLILTSFFVFGVFLSLTPCVLPMIPILVGIIMGQKDIKPFKAFTLSILYVLGVAVTYTLAGIITAMLGNSVQAILQNFWVILVCSLIFVLLSLSLFGLYELQLPSSLMNNLNKASQKTQKGTYIGVFLMGAISSLIVSPCVSAPLAGALIYIASTGNIFLGGSALFFLSLGMGVLLVIAGITGGKLFLKTGMWMVSIRYFLGILMLAMAIWLISRVIPESVTNTLWAILLIGVGYYAGAFEPHKGDTAWIRFRKFIAFLFLLCGILFAVFALTGHIRSIPSSVPQTSVISYDDSLFNVVTNTSELQRLIDKAIKEQTPVFIDYYADWCTACKEMDGTTFKNLDVRHALKSFIAIRADITKSDSDSVKLREKYKVFAPPYFIFLDNKGNLLPDSAIAGFVSADDLLGQLNIISSLYAQN